MAGSPAPDFSRSGQRRAEIEGGGAAGAGKTLRGDRARARGGDAGDPPGVPAGADRRWRGVPAFAARRADAPDRSVVRAVRRAGGTDVPLRDRGAPCGSFGEARADEGASGADRRAGAGVSCRGAECGSRGDLDRRDRSAGALSRALSAADGDRGAGAARDPCDAVPDRLGQRAGARGERAADPVLHGAGGLAGRGDQPAAMEPASGDERPSARRHPGDHDAQAVRAGAGRDRADRAHLRGLSAGDDGEPSGGISDFRGARILFFTCDCAGCGNLRGTAAAWAGRLLSGLPGAVAGARILLAAQDLGNSLPCQNERARGSETNF